MRERLEGLLNESDFLGRTDTEVLLQVFWDVVQQQPGPRRNTDSRWLSVGQNLFQVRTLGGKSSRPARERIYQELLTFYGQPIWKVRQRIITHSVPSFQGALGFEYSAPPPKRNPPDA